MEIWQWGIYGLMGMGYFCGLMGGALWLNGWGIYGLNRCGSYGKVSFVWKNRKGKILAIVANLGELFAYKYNLPNPYPLRTTYITTAVAVITILKCIESNWCCK